MAVYYLKQLLPNLDLTSYENSTILSDFRIPQERKTIMILINHFNKQKTKYVDGPALQIEAEYINYLFPKLTRNYIVEQLDLFKDMPQRVEIVLRTLIHLKQYNDVSTIKVNKRTLPTTLAIPMVSNDYCQPIKIRRIGGANPIYTVERNIQPITVSSPSLNYVSPSIIRPRSPDRPIIRNISNPLFNYPTPSVKCCTVTSVTASDPEVQNNVDIVDESNKVPAADDNSNIMSTQGPINGQNTPQNCDSSSHIMKLPIPSMNSVVSSSDEILNFGTLEEEDVSTSNEQSAILQADEPQPEVFGKNDQLVDENVLPIAQNCTVNSSDETDVLNKAYLDFYSEIEIGDSSTASLGDETLPTVVEETKELIENGPQTSNEQSETKKEDLEDSDKTELLSPFSLNDMLVYDEVTQKQDVSNDNDTNESNSHNVPSTSKQMAEGPFVNAAPSTSKQSDVTEEFDLLQYLREVTNAPTRVILSQCRKLNITNFHEKPNLSFLELIVDNLLTNNVSSENSEEDDPDAVKLVSENVQLKSTKEITLNSVIESIATIRTNMLKNEEPENKPEVKPNPDAQKVATRSKAQEKNNSIKICEPMNKQLVNYLCGIFPDACPDYVKGLCKGKTMSDQVVDELTTLILSSNGQYPKRPVVQPEPDVFPENQVEILTEFLPDADPDYLRMMCDRFEGKPDLVKAFLNEAMERRNYPTLKEYQRRQQLSAQQKQYTTAFNVENFMKIIPDPHKFFSDSTRVVTMDALSSHYALVFLRNAFCKLPVRLIQSTFTKCKGNLTTTYKELQKAMTQSSHLLKSTRKPMEMPNGIQNIPLLQEIAFYSHQREINKYLQEIKEKEEAERQEALSKGLMKTCNCCYDEEVLPKDILACENGCLFCKSCIVKSTEVRFGEGKLDFPCLMNCTSQFSLQTLQAVLAPKLFSKIAQKKAVEEVKAAGIEELETCPFCDFATIPAEGYSIFSCLNPDCMKESCRFCKEPSHIPLKCDEIEKDEDVKARVFVENKMTEALLKKCWKCGIKFFKEEGCNKMTCSCGASMCYVCGKPVTDYKHFNGNGGDRFDLCPLYSDTNVLNKENVLKAAEEAKAEIGNKALKHDPTVDVDKHYNERATRYPQQQLLAQQQRQAEVFLVRMRDALDRLEHRHHHHRHQRPF